jgi:hypothetical protein
VRLGILTGGGDCPGLNAVIRAVVRTAEGVHGDTVIGYRHGWHGVAEGRSIELTGGARNSRPTAGVRTVPPELLEVAAALGGYGRHVSNHAKWVTTPHQSTVQGGRS